MTFGLCRQGEKQKTLCMPGRSGKVLKRGLAEWGRKLEKWPRVCSNDVVYSHVNVSFARRIGGVEGVSRGKKEKGIEIMLLAFGSPFAPLYKRNKRSDTTVCEWRRNNHHTPKASLLTQKGHVAHRQRPYRSGHR